MVPRQRFKERAVVVLETASDFDVGNFVAVTAFERLHIIQHFSKKTVMATSKPKEVKLKTFTSCIRIVQVTAERYRT